MLYFFFSLSCNHREYYTKADAKAPEPLAVSSALHPPQLPPPPLPEAPHRTGWRGDPTSSCPSTLISFLPLLPQQDSQGPQHRTSLAEAGPSLPGEHQKPFQQFPGFAGSLRGSLGFSPMLLSDCSGEVCTKIKIAIRCSPGFLLVFQSERPGFCLGPASHQLCLWRVTHWELPSWAGAGALPREGTCKLTQVRVWPRCSWCLIRVSSRLLPTIRKRATFKRQVDPLCLVWVSESPLLPEGRAPLGWAGKATEELRSEQQPRPGQVGRGRHASFSEKRAH